MENESRESEYFDVNTVRKQTPAQVQEKREAKGFFICGVVAGLSVALLIVCAVYLGSQVKKALGSQEITLESTGVGEQIAASEDSAIDVELVAKLQALERTIDEYYYLEEVSDEELQDGIYRGIMEALSDPYSEYYTAEELEELMTETEGIYYGIGAYVSLDTDLNMPKISGVIAGSPAEEVQLRADDIIYEVNGESTYGMSLTDVVALIKGEEGTEVLLTIYREGESDYLDIPVVRRKVESPTVEWEMLEDDIAYIQITEFDDVTVDQFAEALAMAKGSGMKGMILELRTNPGGSMTAVVDIARMMLPKGLIVYTEDKNGERVEYKCDGKRELDIPLVVLIDGNSASAAEILAGAIQDYGIGTLVGTTTFGKGIVQQIVPFRDGSAVKITVSGYYTPNGRNIHEVGIEPDVVCEFDGETYYSTEDHYDNQLEKAKEVLKEIMENN